MRMGNGMRERVESYLEQNLFVEAPWWSLFLC
jgi:hypothetical protein